MGEASAYVIIPRLENGGRKTPIKQSEHSATYAPTFSNQGLIFALAYFPLIFAD